MVDRRTDRGRRRGTSTLGWLVVGWSIASVVLGVLVAQEAVPVEVLLVDPASYTRLPWYVGLVSSLGILGWATAAVVAGAGSWLADLGERVSATQLLRGGALLSLLTLLDDLFQLHVTVTKALDVPTAAFYAIYLVLGAAWALSSRFEIARTRWPLLAAAVVALGGSIVADQLGPRDLTGLVVEDSLKLLGIIAWAQYFALTAADIGRSVLLGRPAAPEMGHRTLSTVGAPQYVGEAWTAPVTTATTGATGSPSPHR